MTPLFLGGSLTSSAFLPRPKRQGRFKADNHSGMSHIDECSVVDLSPKPMLHPPSDPVTINSGVGNTKAPIFPVFQPTSSRSATTGRRGWWE